MYARKSEKYLISKRFDFVCVSAFCVPGRIRRHLDGILSSSISRTTSILLFSNLNMALQCFFSVSPVTFSPSALFRRLLFVDSPSSPGTLEWLLSARSSRCFLKQTFFIVHFIVNFYGLPIDRSPITVLSQRVLS